LTTALRETQEELGLTIDKEELRFIGVDRRFVIAPDNTWTENEFCWLYTMRLDDLQDLFTGCTDGESEISSVEKLIAI